jgi:putative Holliday junction resolvase
MGRLLGIDYGLKRCGIAVTDPLRIFAAGLTTVPTAGLFDFLETYLKEEEVNMIVLGLPYHESGDPGQLYEVIQDVGSKIKVKFPNVELHYLDERYTSRMAREIILQSGANRKKRQDKALVDKVSAGIILQEFLELIEKQNKV